MDNNIDNSSFPYKFLSRKLGSFALIEAGLFSIPINELGVEDDRLLTMLLITKMIMIGVVASIYLITQGKVDDEVAKGKTQLFAAPKRVVNVTQEKK